MPTILFVCTANQFRSPLAAGLFRQKLPVQATADWTVNSAGIWVPESLPMPPVTRHIAKQLGLDGIDNLMSQQVTRDMLNVSDLIIVMESNQKEAIACEFPETTPRLHLLTDIVGSAEYDIPDPAKTTTSPTEVANELVRLITAGMSKITALAASLKTSRDG